ncbi:PAS domain S-box [Desulfosporosinus orientis DSM 765]|uniref:histidine kinase n=1 Tax=Desulfosporosinus orientis (strain ATCC 19365 / DSM 765 / NCIMB 8382 / VKM B-1628 / Singapore I) TaxID=768706 RepID=G7W7Y7_DESOD|nr:PAS domain S-box protein [Desulfosporosinus orientis]AET66413.1 PAS domain S-box [Desulfosporosinus orientis DSM 765]
MSVNEIMELKQRIESLEAALEEAREDNRFWGKFFLENSWGMVIADTIDGKMLRVNPRYAQMHGYQPLELIGKSIYDVICAPGHQKDRLQVEPKLDQDRYEYNSVHVRKDGTCFPVHIYNREITVNKRRLRIVSIWDITENELKRKEFVKYRESLEALVKFRTDELEKTNERLRIEIQHKETAENELAKINEEMFNILDSIEDYFKAVNREWVITYANKAMVKALEANGFSGNIVGRDYWEVYEGFSKAINDACEKVMNYRVPTRFETFAQSIKQWVEVSIYPTGNGISIFLRNIEEKRKIEKAIEEENHRLYSLFNSFPGLIYVQEENHKIRFANEAFQAKFGACLEQACYEVIAGKSLPCTDCMSSHVLRSLTPVWKEMVFDNRIYEVYSQPFIDANGSRLIFKVLLDITDRRSADQEMARFERLNIVGEMAAGIAHEVRNPLTTVRGFLQLLQSKKETIDYHDYYQLMRDELDRALSILTDFLGLAKDGSYQFELINITKTVTALAPLLTADAINQDKKIVFELREVPNSIGSENELRQLILNLTRNGLEAMPKNTTLTIQTYQWDNDIVLRVCDQGGGVDPAVLDKLGTPFLTTKEQGTGLGIATCKRIAERHKAVLDFKSKETGTVVTVKFPAPEF